ncbi:TonB-dependent receptor [Brumimicrobium aurantiacum]|uniref:TonB-dependent receptor n=1 Tax=Brumimicrobium aurantiacum TaxID=1737063 RepID=A0A3E1EVA9_9FLAO|nr:TonB-dependent receptor [Brumimicrobium aurantiacum]RFC53499.1 TonB-dependent receptor [Brumimicrobium aurantiacum]
MNTKHIQDLFFLIMIIGISMVGKAQTGSIKGKITANGEPLPKASLYLPELSKSERTNVNGEYTITGLKEGIYKIRISYNGHIAIDETFEIKSGEVKVMDFEMTEDVLQLEGAVISGTRKQIEKYNTPVIVNTISNRTFETTQSLTISEGLNFSPGLRMENNCQNCGFNQLRMNGLEGPYSQILVNSRPIFSALAGVYGLEMLPANMVDKIEVVRGGGSVLYGGNAIGGSVNIITKDPIVNSFEVGINQSFIDFDTPDRTITLNGSIVSDDFKKGITIFGYNRSRDPWDANGDGFSEMTKQENNTFGFDAFWNTSERSKLKLGLYSISEFRRGGNKFDLEPHQSDITEQLDHKILSTNISYEQFSKNKKHKLSVYGSAQFVNRDSYYGAGGSVLTENDTIISLDDIIAINAYGKSKDISTVGGLQYNYEINKMFNLTTGAEYQYNDVMDEMPGYERTVDQEVKTIGSYAQLEFRPIEKLTFLLGGRYDHIDILGNYQLGSEDFNDDKSFDVFVPRLSAMYEINKDLKFRASYAQGYRAPQAFDEDLHIESVGGDVRFISLSPDLEMERSNSITASLNYSKTLKKTQMNFVLEGFYNQLNNPFILSGQTALPTGTSVIVKRNGDGASVQGINLEANFAIGSKFIFQSGATIQSATYSKTEEIWAPEDSSDPTPATTTDRLLRTPDAYGYFTISYKPTRSLSLSYSGVYTGTMEVPHVIDIDSERTIIEEAPSFFEHNIKVAYNFKIEKTYKIELFAGIQNIFNSYQTDFDIGAERDAGYVYGPSRPRTLFMGLKMGLN